MELLYDAKQIAVRDPAARSVAGVIFLYPGFHALIYHKFSQFFFDIKTGLCHAVELYHADVEDPLDFEIRELKNAISGLREEIESLRCQILNMS